MAYYIAKVLTRRDQLGMRKKKGKGKGDKGKKSDAEDGECDQGSQKRKKPRVAGKKKHGKTNTTKRARKVKGKDSEAEVCDTPDAPGSSKGGQKNAVCKGKAKSKASPKKRGSPKSTRKPVPKASPKKKSRGSKVKPSAGSPSELPGGSAADDVEPGKVKEPMPKRRTRRVATPQAHVSAPVGLNLQDLKRCFWGEIAHQWKSGKKNLKGGDFSLSSFEKTTLSCYYSRARPSIGLRGKKKDYPMRTNLECYNFSFNLKDVLNVGLAMKCALVAVSWLMVWNFKITLALEMNHENSDLLFPNIAKTEAEWIDQQALDNDDFDIFSEPVQTHLSSIKETALAAIEDYKAESPSRGGADVDWFDHLCRRSETTFALVCF